MPVGAWLLLLAALLALVGAALLWAPGLVSWFGRLPGDIDVRVGGGRLIVPIVSMLVVSVVLSLLLALLSRGR